MVVKKTHGVTAPILPIFVAVIKWMAQSLNESIVHYG